jgi:hypothetical protein
LFEEQDSIVSTNDNHFFNLIFLGLYQL